MPLSVERGLRSSLALEFVAQEDVVAAQTEFALVVLGGVQEGAHLDLEKGEEGEEEEEEEEEEGEEVIPRTGE